MIELQTNISFGTHSYKGVCMIGIDTREPSDGMLDFDGAGGMLPPITAEGTPDEFGNQDDWGSWEAEVDPYEVLSSRMRHPSVRNSYDDIYLTQALLQDGWRDKHQRMKEAIPHGSIFGDDVVRIEFPSPPTPYDLPPEAA